jgi:DNA repair protein RecN (Recombination protein N)
MLRELTIRNFAIIDDLSIGFEEGLNILTGETGAGKSIIVNAVDLILGGRVAADLVRTSEETAELEALFDVPLDSDAARAAREQGIDVSEGLVIRRVIQKNGRHKSYVNGRLSTTQTLGQISQHLAGIAGQHANQSLSKPEHFLLVLDQFGGTCDLREEVSCSYNEILPLTRKHIALKKQLQEQGQRVELLAFQVNEIEQAQVRAGEDQELEQERLRLRHAERIYETVGRCVERLYSGEGAVVEQLASMGKDIESLSAVDPALNKTADRMKAASYELEDISSDLNAYLQGIVFDTDRLEAVERRLHALQVLARKYGGSLESVLGFWEEAQKELERVSSLPEEIAATEKAVAEVRGKLVGLCRDLSAKRRSAAMRLAKGVEKEVASLGMPKTRFEIRFSPVPIGKDTDAHLTVGDGGIEATGMDRVEFLISPNVGEDLRPLAQIASGGELSRIVLALKALLAKTDSVETLIFDEVDAGIGGRVAEMVGEKLDALARYHQIICITHLPHIARFGRAHFKIEKRVRGGRTESTIVPVRGEARVQEMARMLAGAKITTKVLDHAREMIERDK